MRTIAILFLILYGRICLPAQTPALTLEKAVELFLNRNIEVQAARAQIDRARAEQIAAKLRPNPTLTVTAENLKFSGPDTATVGSLRELRTTYEETIELGGKRQLRENVAGRALSVAEAMFANVLREKLAEVKQSYFEAVLARHNLDVAIENRQTFEQLLSFNLARFEEGAIAEGDLLKVRLERMKFDAAVRKAELLQAQAMIYLLEKLEEPDFAVQPLAGSLDVALIDLDLDQLKQSAFRNRPDLRAAASSLELAADHSALERARATPDLRPSVGYKRLGSSNTLLFGLSVPLAIRNRNQGEIAKAAASEKVARLEREVVENRVRVEVEIAFTSYAAARDQVVTFRDRLLRQADESRSITLAAYEEGAVELLPVLEAQRTRSEIRQQYYRTLFDYQSSVLQLELAVGEEIRR